MAKSKTQSRSQQKKMKKQQQPSKTPEELYALAVTSLETSEPEQARSYAQQLLLLVDPDLANSPETATPTLPALAALNLLGDISVELGEIEDAVKYFSLGVKGDSEGTIPEEQGGGAEKFLWLAQLSEEGGADSVRWYEKGVQVLKAQIAALEAQKGDDEEREVMLQDKRAKVANALCGVVEIYMTDLSWESDAETRCEALVTEALIFAPESAEALQTLASVRLSQLQFQDAQSALERSMALWKDLDPEDDGVPDFPTRISLARLLMEAEMEDEAMDVLERLALEDDQSVEACYLGGWCLHLIADKDKKSEDVASNGEKRASDAADEEYLSMLKQSRKWLLNTLRLYQLQEYEDDRLKDHTTELIQGLNETLGPVPEGAEDDEDEEEWIEDGEGEDEEMADT